MPSYDRNGLRLAEACTPNSINSYYNTSIELKLRKISANCRAKPRHSNDWSLYSIGDYTDPRDAAYVAQVFAEKYTPAQIRQMVTDGIFYETARDFRETLEIPEWKYPAEGLSIEEILCENPYKMNYVDSPREALIEALKVFNKKPPALAMAKELIAKVKSLYDTGLSYREAAKITIEVL